MSRSLNDLLRELEWAERVGSGISDTGRGNIQTGIIFIRQQEVMERLERIESLLYELLEPKEEDR